MSLGDAGAAGTGGAAHNNSRRSFLAAIAAAAAQGATSSREARGQDRPSADHGAIKPPVPVPDIRLIRHDGVATTLHDLVSSHVTALQLMFTSCTTTCPIQGAIFSRVQKLIPEQLARGVQLVSVSVDPEHDTPAVLTGWLRRFHGRPGWVAAVPRADDLEPLRDFAGRGRSASDNHSTQVQMINRKGLLVWRTGELPDAEEIAAILRRL